MYDASMLRSVNKAHFAQSIEALARFPAPSDLLFDLLRSESDEPPRLRVVPPHVAPKAHGKDVGVLPEPLDEARRFDVVGVPDVEV
jgi:hypothetical protein